jgi:hypothetical protein
MADVKVGKDGKVTLGANTVVGMGTWSIDGITTDEYESSSFGDTWKSFAYGMKDGGTVSFNGHYVPTDVTGQQMLQRANLYNSEITDLRLFIDNTSYFTPCASTGYFSPNLTTGAPTRASNVRITTFNVGMDKSGLGTINFTAKVSGLMVLV